MWYVVFVALSFFTHEDPGLGRNIWIKWPQHCLVKFFSYWSYRSLLCGIEVYTTTYRGNIQTLPLCDIITWWPLHANTHTHTTHTTHHTPRTTRRMTIMRTTAPPAAPAGRPIPPISALLACTWSACCYSGNIRSLRSRSNMTEWRDNSEVSLAIIAYYTCV